MVMNQSPRITEAEMVNRGNPSSPAIATPAVPTTGQLEREHALMSAEACQHRPRDIPRPYGTGETRMKHKTRQHRPRDHWVPTAQARQDDDS